MDLCIIIVSYNTRDLLRQCLKSLRERPCACSHEIVVVDNASHDGSADMVRDEFPEVRLLSQGSNLGYAAGNNLALRDLNARYALILNSDIEVQPGAIDALLAFMDDCPEAGIAGAQLILPDGRPQETWQQGFNLGEYVRQQFYLGRLARQSVVATGGPPVEVLHLHGACLMVRREAMVAVGLLDEGYFMYCEDSDWGLRFRRAGWNLYLVPAARMLHHHGASSRQTRAGMIAAYNRAAARYFRLHYGPISGAIARIAGTLGITLRLVGAAILTAATLGLVPGLRRRTALFARAWWLQLR